MKYAKLMEGNFSKLRSLCSQEGMSSSTFRIPHEGNTTAIVKMYGGFPLAMEQKYPYYDDIFRPMDAELEAYTKLRDLQGSVVPRLLGHGYFLASEADYKGWCILMEDVGTDRPLRSSQRHFASAQAGALQIHDRGVAGVVTIGSMGLRRTDQQVVFYDFAQTQSQKFKYMYLNDRVYLNRIFSINSA